MATDDYMSFDIDQDADVLVAYEKLDYLDSSSIPDWLNDFKKDQKSEIVAQYRYYDVYSKPFKKGSILLPGADKKNNGVGTNYFVMVKPSSFDNRPEINIQRLPNGIANTYYREKLSILYGHGKLNWELINGNFPEGLKLNPKGLIEGIPIKTGSYSFTIKATDEKDQNCQETLSLVVN